ncbi:MAG: Exodeoxyribonuclease [Chroococcopsis gigantea SAG 12.99]|jgi:exodeoxyribonuclease-3|nr:exodeoxyribonuclease III [Chlorogloea purpurea SAG 13.99]MDV3002143.1 Exodeoxyribonuclease [Chroococcopsis gigantea SAG 12.99]
MKVATWNVNSIRMRIDAVTNWLTLNDIDVVCLQETKVIDKDFPLSHFESLGYHVYIHGQKSYNGVAIFSRQPMTDLYMGFSPILGTVIAQELDEQKRVISGVIDDVRIVNLYVPNGADVTSDKYTYKLTWLGILKEYLTRLKASAQLCVCGDFNIALEDRDIYNPKGKEKSVMATPAERNALSSVLEIGLQDAFRKFTSEGGHYTWWDYRAGGLKYNRGWRIDHHYLTPELYERAKNCVIDKQPREGDKPSDHTPVIVQF